MGYKISWTQRCYYMRHDVVQHLFYRAFEAYFSHTNLHHFNLRVGFFAVWRRALAHLMQLLFHFLLASPFLTTSGHSPADQNVNNPDVMYRISSTYRKSFPRWPLGCQRTCSRQTDDNGAKPITPSFQYVSGERKENCRYWPKICGAC